MFARIKKRLPGPKASAFWLSAAGLVSVYKYNKSQSDQRLQYYCQRAAHAANETIGSLDTPRKVHVYIAVPMGELGTRKARQHWERYILPVFAAGALDYELTLVNDTATESNGVERVVRGGVHRMVAEEIRERRRRRLEAEEENGELRLWRAAIDERKRENEARALKNRLGVEPGMSVLELWKAQEYPGVMDVVAIGRETWVEAVNGISEGASGSLNLQVPELVALDSEQNKKLNTEQNAELNTEPNAEQNTEQNTELNTEQGAAHEAGSLADNAGEPAHVVNYDRFDDGAAVALPAVAYIAHANLTGWGAVPLRIRNFFHDQQNVDEYACQALQVVYESTRRAARGAGELEAMGRAEEQMKGWEGQEPLEVVVDPQVAARLQIYDTQNDTAPFKD